MTFPERKFLGFGLGLRTEHFQHVLDEMPEVDWFEILSENFMVAGGKPRYYLDQIKERYPLVMHGVSLSIGSVDPLNFEYLENLKKLTDYVQPAWFSDHLCWTSFEKMNSHDLLPLPYNEEAIVHVSDRISQVQDYIGRPFLIENLSSYLTYKNSDIEEWEFLNEIATRSGCKILLDINNIYVSSRNHGFKATDYVDAISPELVQQFHLAGHSDYGDYVVDTHDHDICDSVWDLYRYALKCYGPVSTMIERDDNIPKFPELFDELQDAKTIAYEEFPDLIRDTPVTKVCSGK